MKKSSLACALAVTFALSVLLYLALSTAGGKVAPPASEPREVKQPEPWAPLLPAGWEVSGVKEEVLGQVNLPFLHKQLVGKRVKVASIKGDTIRFTGPKSTHPNPALNRGTITVLAETGQLVQVELRPAVDPGPVLGQLPIEETEERYRWTSETYEGLPEAASTPPLQEVLDRIYEGCSDPLHRSQRIQIAYVVNLRKGIREPTPLWVVNCYGMPPMGMGGPPGSKPGPLGSYSRMRYLMDRDGKLIGADNQP